MIRKSAKKIDYVLELLFAASTELKSMQYGHDLTDEQKNIARRIELAIDHDAFDLRPLINTLKYSEKPNTWIERLMSR